MLLPCISMSNLMWCYIILCLRYLSPLGHLGLVMRKRSPLLLDLQINQITFKLAIDGPESCELHSVSYLIHKYILDYNC